MQYANLTEKLTAYIQAGFPAFYVQTAETERADALIAQVAEKLSLNVMEYNLAVGKVNFQNKAKLAENAGRLENSLKDLYDEDLENQIILIKNAKLALENNPVAISRLLHLIEKAEKNNQQSPSEPCTIILQSAELFIPADIEPYITVLELPLPQDKEIQQLVKNQFNSLDKHLVNRLSTALSGLNELEIKKLLILIKNRFPKIENNIEEIFSEIQSQKEQIIAKSGVLGMVKGTNNIDDIGGLENLKQWLKEQNEILTHLEEAQHFGVKAPKGVLIAGMPGCGKSLTAKAASTLFQQPLLRLDIGSLLGKYVGESETNMRKALAMAESISPCVLWVDELEKAFVGMTGNNSSEVSSRLLGYFLTWMQEKTKPVFIVATANDITALPPELLRKGRFDEIFYVGFPNTTERKAILTIHLTKAKQNVEEFDLVELAQSCRDYSGADIENTVYEAVKKAFLTQNKTLTQAILLEAIKNTIPLRKTMKDKVGEYEKKFDELYLTAASDSEDLSIAKMIRMSESTNYLDRLKVAESEDATEDLLIKLSNDSNETVKLATLYNNNCPTSVLIKEFESGYESVVLRHKNFPFDLAIEYFKDGNKSNFAWFAHYNPNIIDKNNLITLLKSMKNKNLQTILGAYLSHPRLEEEEKKS
ncbi:AAA family ATPase [Actinobacillus genomosp. 1]|uniref:AAA family ATPase n=1 Tax=Actinobacillus genomosp. 1 TaxID=254839 RepID=UPI0024410F65|nr:AAA family ATPase [Actinobacillus genomosp. 1]WGE35065.1 AAA family ATPase [Actinobacillus genomosp. 1]